MQTLFTYIIDQAGKQGLSFSLLLAGIIWFNVRLNKLEEKNNELHENNTKYLLVDREILIKTVDNNTKILQLVETRLAK